MTCLFDSKACHCWGKLECGSLFRAWVNFLNAVYFNAGYSIKTFAYLDMKLTDSNFKRCKYACIYTFLSFFLSFFFLHPFYALCSGSLHLSLRRFPNFPKPILGLLVVCMWTFVYMYLYELWGNKAGAAVRAVACHKNNLYLNPLQKQHHTLLYLGCSLQLVLKLNNKANNLCTDR